MGGRLIQFPLRDGDRFTQGQPRLLVDGTLSRKGQVREDIGEGIIDLVSYARCHQAEARHVFGPCQLVLQVGHRADGAA